MNMNEWTYHPPNVLCRLAGSQPVCKYGLQRLRYAMSVCLLHGASGRCTARGTLIWRLKVLLRLAELTRTVRTNPGGSIVAYGLVRFGDRNMLRAAHMRQRQ